MNPIGAEKNDLVTMIAQFRDDPRFFVQSVLGATPQRWQGEALDAVAHSSRNETSHAVAVLSTEAAGATRWRPVASARGCRYFRHMATASAGARSMLR